MVLYLANPYTVYPFVHVGRPNQIGVLVLVFNGPIPKLERWESASKMGTQQKPSCVIKLGQFIIYRVLTLHLVQTNPPFIDWKTYPLIDFLLKIKNYTELILVKNSTPPFLTVSDFQYQTSTPPFLIG